MKANKIPFDIVAMEDAKIFANVKTPEDLEQALKDYRNLLDACGWTEEEYEKIMLARIDGQWGF